MPEGVAGLVVDPAGASGAAVSARSKLSSVAAVAVDLARLLEGVVGEQRLLAGRANGALLVVDLALDVDSLGAKDGTSALGAVSLGFVRLDGGGIDQFVVDIRRSGLWTILSSVATFAVEISVGSVVGGQTIQETVALHAAETVLVIPKACSGNHFFCFKHFSVTLGATVNVALLRFDDPSLNGGSG